MFLHIGNHVRNVTRHQEHKHHGCHHIIEVFLNIGGIEVVFKRADIQFFDTRQLFHVLNRVRIIIDSGNVKTFQTQIQRISTLTAAHIQNLADGYDAFGGADGRMCRAHAVFLIEIVRRLTVKRQLDFRVLRLRRDKVPCLRMDNPIIAFRRQFVRSRNIARFVHFIEVQTALEDIEAAPSTGGGIVFGQ